MTTLLTSGTHLHAPEFSDAELAEPEPELRDRVRPDRHSNGRWNSFIRSCAWPHR